MDKLWNTYIEYGCRATLFEATSLLIVEMKNITTTLGDSLVDSHKIRKIFLTIHSLARSSIHAPWHLYKRAENRISHKNLNMGVYSSFILNCQNLEAIMMSFNRLQGKWITVHSNSGILFNAKKKWATKYWKDTEEH